MMRQPLVQVKFMYLAGIQQLVTFGRNAKRTHRGMILATENVTLVHEEAWIEKYLLGTCVKVLIDHERILQNVFPSPRRESRNSRVTIKTEGPIVQEKGALMDMHRVGIGRRVGVQPPFGHPDLRIEMVMG
jgi:hypothetical protein